MASRTAQKKSSLPERPSNNAIDNYDVDDDPFAESGDEAPNNDSQSKKRKEATGLGIDEAVAVQKKARVPTVKLDESRFVPFPGIFLLSQDIDLSILGYCRRRAYRDYEERPAT